MKRKRLLALFVGGVFIAAVMSLHRMLEQEAKPQQEAPAGQGDQDLSRLAQKIDRLERLLSDNNRLVATLRDSLLHPKGDNRGGANVSSAHSPADSLPGCRLADETKGGADEVQLLDVYDRLPFDNPPGGVWKQGFDIRYQGDEWDETPLEVILVPHSHNDPGWLKTFDNYYHDQTKHILNNMLTKLSEDSRRKMIWAEISYFSKWWEELDQKKRDTVKRLLAGGQLEIVTGGWVMADEANSHYYALLDQLIEGHQWIQTHLGVKPSSGWAIDPFGHSPSMAYLLKGAGLSNMVIQRVHYAVKKEFARQKTLEFKWRQSWDSSPLGDITCHMMPFYSYDVPHTCGPDPAVCCQFDFHRLPGGRVFCPWRVPPQPITEQNVHERALLLLDQYRRKSRLFRSPVLFVPLGDDFRFVESSEWDAQFRNYQKLFDFFQTHPELHVSARFGTLSDYFQALQKVLPVSSLPTVRGDFFTYADRDDHYWSGYFTSRPFYKRLDRTLEATLRATEILYSLTLAAMRSHGDGRLATGFPAQDHFLLLTAGRRGLALFQHHDAVTGTARDPVVMDYGNRLLESIQKLRKVLQSSAHWLLLLDKSQYHHDQSKPFLLTDDVMSAQDALPQKTKITLSEEPRILIVYNPTEQIQSSVVSVVIDSPDAQVIDAETGRPMAAQISAVWAEPSRASTDSFQLDFLSELPPLSLVVYHVTRSSSGSAPRARYTFHRRGNPPTIHSEHFQMFSPQGPEANVPLSLSNKHVQIWSSPETGLMQKLRLRAGSERRVQVHFLWYGTRTGANRDKSGAYLFLPGEEGAQMYSFSEPPLVRVSRGPLYSDITSCLRHVTHTVRLYHLEGHAGRSLEISNMVDIRSQVNRELVMRIVTDVASGNRFHSDLNSFQMQQRRTLSKLPLQANFYPMTSTAFLQDAETRITVLSAQSQGVASLRPGELELVLDRRLQQDDNRGLGQGVTDNKRTSSLYHLLLEERRGGQEVGGASVEHLSLLAHLTSLSLSHPPITMVAPGDVQVPKLRPFLPLRSSLPCDLHLLNLRTLEDPQEAGSPSQEVALLLHRKGFDCSSAPEPALQCTWSAHEEVDLAAVFAPLRFSALRRCGLTMLRHDDELQSARQQQTRIISLRPMDISAFRVEVQ
ncbi:alpha-mannosidase 2-like isoform X1 [Gymnodraco acuticeps]|uniref:Alpha-mannosidase n=3 Tax=Gymnodraco acuticeps TaxID=8218 RepID=A0A6P8WGL7_GYMAC|nr:alpha-mannosidase 2-like isoform X1 [Gymnodraco acuticeps]XP_034096590.1 alpha-mannosidase 2-like isoform X1 [Gymnodraco acuticeps]XP_034096591.1 alpha-mannosidase 2-like isoform X1 [Gymnodraco acuticeps]